MTASTIATKQPISITNIAAHEVLGCYSFYPGEITVRTTRWGDCTYAYNATAESWFRGIVASGYEPCGFCTR